MPPVNNITRMLEQRKVPYTAYDLPVEKLGAQKTAQLLGVSIEIVFKTIVAARDKPGKPILAAIPGNRQLDLKALAAALGEKKVRLTTQREAEQMTGLLAGGISPLALIQKGFQTVIDQSAQNYTEIHISGGQRGLNIRLPVADLASLTHARFAPISMEASGEDEIE